MPNIKRILTASFSAAMLSALPGCIPQVRPPAGYNAPSSGAYLEVEEGVYAPPPKPIWDGGRAVQNIQNVQAGSYIVQPGDTLRGVGNRTGAGSEAIAAANNITPPYTLFAGQKLIIPAGRYHLVAAGETGIAIAQVYGARWMDIVAANGLEEPYVLRIGQRLRLPDAAMLARPVGDATSSPDMEHRAAAFDLGIADVVSGSQPAIAEGAAPAAAQSSIARPAVPLSTAVKVPDSFGGAFAWPAKGKVVEQYGAVSEGKKNEGIKIAAPLGSPVKAAARGTIVYAGDQIGVLGGLVLIDHGGGWVTAYGHLGSFPVVRGDAVNKGQNIGAVGDTGYGTGPRLHFEIRRDLKPVDPLLHLPVQ